jgi:hypothetical protein
MRKDDGYTFEHMQYYHFFFGIGEGHSDLRGHGHPSLRLWFARDKESSFDREKRAVERAGRTRLIVGQPAVDYRQ